MAPLSGRAGPRAED